MDYTRKTEKLFTNWLQVLQKQAAKILNEKHDYQVYSDKLELYIWPQMFSHSNPFGAGVCSDTKHEIICFRNRKSNDCVLILLDRLQYRKEFTIQMPYFEEKK